MNDPWLWIAWALVSAVVAIALVFVATAMIAVWRILNDWDGTARRDRKDRK